MEESGATPVPIAQLADVAVPLYDIRTRNAGERRRLRYDQRRDVAERSRFTDPVEMRLTNMPWANVEIHHPRGPYIRPENVTPVLVCSRRQQQARLTPLDIALKVWDAPIAQKWCELTTARLPGAYTSMCCKSLYCNKKRFPDKKEVTHRDFYHLLGVTLLLGQLEGCTQHEIWGRKGRDVGVDDGKNGICCAIQECMDEKTYVVVHHASCFSDCAGCGGDRHACRIDWLSNDVFRNARSLYSPTAQLTLDDQSVAFQGRCPDRRGPRKRKANKYALQYDSLNDMRGFTLGIQQQRKGRGCGRASGDSGDAQEESEQEEHSNDEECTKNHRILSLIKSCVPRGGKYELFCDSEYTNYRLFDDLWEVGVAATGTIRTNWLTYSLHALREPRKKPNKFTKGA